LIDDSGVLDLSDLVQTYTFGMRYDSLDSRSKILNQVMASVGSGEILESEALNSGQDKEFTKLNAEYSLLTFLHIPWFNSTSRMIFKSSLQYSAETLPPVEQYSLAGPNKVRAYEVTQFSADSAIYAGIDWIFNMPELVDFNIDDTTSFASIVQPFVFLDYGYGVLNEITVGGDQTGELSGYGVGLQLNYKNKISGNLQFAFPIDYKFSQESIEDPKDDVRAIVDVQYFFN
jgi:hemolysin activation/secretion protein